MTEHITALEQVFYFAAFITGFLGMLVAGIVIHDFIDRNKRRLHRLFRRGS